LELREVEPAVQGRDLGPAHPPRQRKVQVIDVEVQHVELTRQLADLLEHDQVRHERVDRPAVEPERPRPGRDELGLRHGVAAGNERDLVSLAGQFFGQQRNDSFGAAVQPGGTLSYSGAICAILMAVSPRRATARGIRARNRAEIVPPARVGVKTRPTRQLSFSVAAPRRGRNNVPAGWAARLR